MPTYEYRCKACGNQLEVVQSFTDEPLTECPACSGALRKVFGSIGITFKGSGFYKTDSRSSSTKATTNGSSTSDTASGSGGSTGSSDAGSSGSGSSGSGSSGSGAAESKTA